MTDFHKTFVIWVVVDTSTTHVVCPLTECAYFIPHLHICSDWLMTKKTNIKGSVLATVMKLGMWVVEGTCITHQVCCH